MSCFTKLPLTQLYRGTHTNRSNSRLKSNRSTQASKKQCTVQVYIRADATKSTRKLGMVLNTKKLSKVYWNLADILAVPTLVRKSKTSNRRSQESLDVAEKYFSNQFRFLYSNSWPSGMHQYTSFCQKKHLKVTIQTWDFWLHIFSYGLQHKTIYLRF